MANYTITPTLTNVEFGSFGGVISPDNGYEVPSSITVSGATLSSYDSSTGAFVVTNPQSQQSLTTSSAGTLPRSLSDLNGGMINGSLYMLGGAGINGSYSEYLPIALKYDTSNGTVTTLSVTPPALIGRATAIVNDCLYLFGGSPSTGASTSANKYDPSTNTLTTITSLPSGRSNFHAAAYGNKIFLFGGSTGDTAHGISGLYSDTIYIYNITNNSYTTSATTLPYKMTPGSVVVYGDYAYIFGATRVNDAGTSTTYTRQIFKFNLQTQAITTATATLPSASLEGGSWSAGVINDKIYLSIMTGRTSSANTGKIYVYDPVNDTMTDTNVSPYFATAGSCFGIAGNTLYMAGGLGIGSSYTNIIQKLTVENVFNISISATCPQSQPVGYSVTFDCSNYFGPDGYYAQYSLDNGTTWIDFQEYVTYTITNVTQIKFRVSAGPYGGTTWPKITAPSLSLLLESDGSSTVFTSDNYTLSYNISDVTVSLYFD